MVASSLKQGTRTATRWPACGRQSPARTAIAFINSPRSKPLAKMCICRTCRVTIAFLCSHVLAFGTHSGACLLAVIVPFESRSPATIDRLSELVAADMDRVNTTILSRTGSQVAMIPEVANHLISSGGKRLRPMLTLAMARLAGYPGSGHVKLAAAVEFMHTATLLHDDVVDESEMRRAKPAELFAAACEVGPALAARPKDEQNACRSFGMNLGIAFQLVDDALDYGGKAAKLGKNTGDDFREGKITLPVVLSFRRGSESERAFWRRTLEESEATDADLEYAVSLMMKHRALEDTIARARHYGSMATDALALFPPSAMKEALEETVEFCISRSN